MENVPSLEELAVAACDGDAQAAEVLCEMARRRLISIGLALGIPPDDVGDVVQDVLFSAWRNLARFDPSAGSFLGWLTPGLKGRAINRHRGHNRREGLLQKLRLAEPRSHEPHGAVEARATLAKLLAVLTERQREVVALYELGGLSGQETAQILGIGEAGVRSIARDARRRLKEEARRFNHPQRRAS